MSEFEYLSQRKARIKTGSNLCAFLLCTIVFTSFAAAAAPPAPTASPKKEKKICRSEEVLGSHFSSTICLTQTQWDDRDQDFQQRARKFMDESSRRSTPPGSSLGSQRPDPH